MADLIAGLAIGVPGAVVVGRWHRDPVGWLLVMASLLWFAGTLAPASGTVGSVGRELQFAHRGLLLLAVVAPIASVGSTRRSNSWIIAGSVVLVGGAGTVSLGRWATSAALLAIVAAMALTVAIAGFVRGVAVPWRAAWAAAFSATVLWVAAAIVSSGSVGVDPDVRLVGYQVGAAFTGVAMGASRSVRGGAVDEIVRVGRASGLGGALGDLDLRLGFESPSGGFVAADGAPVAVGGSQVVTDLDLGVDGRARVVHRPGLLEDRRVRRDVETAAHLLAAHRRLTAEVQQSAADVGASRARLVVAEDRASMAFWRELGGRVVPHVDAVLATLGPEGVGGGNHRELATAVRAELASLAVGAAPQQLDAGLRPALVAMAAAAPIATELALDDVDIDDEGARTLYFVAAEAMSNAMKHSGGGTVVIRLVSVDGGVELRIDDDGTGRIALRPGGGLMGLSDRLAAAGGTLCCGQGPSGGASVAAWLPITRRRVQSMRSHSGTVNRSM
jgi:signal transduction histidine kinase